MKTKREEVIRQCIADAIADETEDLEDVIGYISSGDLLRAMFDIAIEYASATATTSDEIVSIFENALLVETPMVILTGDVAEA
jgi:hypothetical protein